MSEYTSTDSTATPHPPTPVAPREASLGLGQPRLTLTHGGQRLAEHEFDALADLFLGDDPVGASALQTPIAPGVPHEAATMDSDDASADSLAAPPIEGLILGHLPVSASSWVKTYAAMRARALGGPVGLIRLMGGSLAIDLVGVDSRGTGEIGSVEEAISALRERAVGVVARVDELGEPDLAGGAIDGLVVLSGGDDAAVVGAFRTIKSLAGVGSIEQVPMRVAIVGHDPEGAHNAFGRIARSAMHSLAREISFAGSVERLASEPSASLYHGAWGGSIGDLLDRLVEPSVSVERGDVAAGMPIEPAAIGAAERTGGASESAGVVSGAVDGLDLAHTVGERVGRSLAPVCESATDVKTATNAGDPPESEVSDRGSLTGLLEGLLLSEIRSPVAPEVEFAVDEWGRLQVVCELAQAGMVDAVLGWAVRHEALLRLADPRIRAVDADCIARLVCTNAVSARAWLDGRHRVLLLVEVEAGHRMIRVIRALN